MLVWIVDGDERWAMDTSRYEGAYRHSLEAELQRDGHAWRDSQVIVSLETIRKMAQREEA